ncbi:ArsR/SmtB family transcription factor [Pseudomonas aeruginosa]|uniref:ArsR/SmtB family transcription factor n=1 Tax=Pseudomonas aeruginosa TaxID=287 RepID=UPI003AF30DED
MGVQVSVESLSKCSWNGCPSARGIPSELDGGRPKSTMSHHFRVLRDAGLVQTQTIGTTHMNSLRRDDLNNRFPGLLETILSQRG